MQQSIKDDPYAKCPKCGSKKIRRLLSRISAIIYKGRQANQYEDCKGAKYWRDNDGNRHRVTAGDGDSRSPTVSSRRKRSDEQVKAIKKQASTSRQKRLSRESYARFVKNVKKH